MEKETQNGTVGSGLIYGTPSEYTIKIFRWCLGISAFIAVIAVIVRDNQEIRSLLEFLTGTWPGTVYKDLFDNKNGFLLFIGVFLRVLTISLVAMALSAMAAGFLRREVMKFTDVILNRDELVKAKLRAMFYNALEQRKVNGELPEIIDDALETGFKQAHEEWVKYVEKRSKLPEGFLNQKV